MRLAWLSRVFILWLGWFGFNPGSTTAANKDIAMIFVNTNLAAAAGAVLAMLTSWLRFGKPEVGMSLNGALAGLVAITSPCATVTPLSAIIIGAAAGIRLKTTGNDRQDPCASDIKSSMYGHLSTIHIDLTRQYHV